MVKHAIILALIAVSVLATVQSLKCISNACDTIDCQPIDECGPGEKRGKGGHCLCCDVCRKIVGENADCAPESHIGGAISDKVTCDTGLLCHRGICQRTEVVFGENL